MRRRIIKNRHTKRNTRQSKQDRGEQRVVNKKPSFDSHWTLDWFEPSGDQHLIVEGMEEKELTVVVAPSGTGKSTTVLWKALSDYREGKYKQIWLVKNPTEAGDDILGLLVGDKQSKLESHIEAMKTIFHQFMTKEKLQNDMAAGNIVIDIPNYLLGRTIDYALIIVEEAQVMSPNTIKLVCERAGVGSKVVVIGDPKQAYSVKKRPDGLKDLVEKVTVEHAGYRHSKYPNRVSYVRMESNNNMRSNLSRFITELYE